MYYDTQKSEMLTLRQKGQRNISLCGNRCRLLIFNIAQNRQKVNESMWKSKLMGSIVYAVAAFMSNPAA